MNNVTGKKLALWIAEELGKNCSRLSLETEPGYYQLFEAFIKNVSLQGGKAHSGGFVTQLDSDGEDSHKGKKYSLDYYCRKHMGITPGAANYEIFDKCLTDFDEYLNYNLWRKFGADGRSFSEERAEIFICCSAHARDRSLKQHLAEFFKDCRDRKLKLTCLENHQGAINKLIAEQFSPDKSLYPANETWSNKNRTASEQDSQTTSLHPKALRIDLHREDIYKIENKDASNARSLYVLNDSSCQNLDNIASLLDWKYHLTPFRGRERELGQLHDWIATAKDKSVQLIYGDGGTGKTRLAFHFANLLSGQEWEAGQTHDQIDGDWIIGQAGMLLIIDRPEERTDKVYRLLRALDNMKGIEEKIYILLVSRNLSFLEKLANEAPGIHTNNPIRLASLENEEWSLFNDAWQELQKLFLASTRENTVCDEIQCPILHHDLSEWLKKQGLANKQADQTPLMIIALAVYLFSEKGRDEVDLSKLDFSKIIRRFTCYETNRITKEIENAKKSGILSSHVSSQGVLLTKAMTTICGGMSDETARNIVSDLKQHDIDYPPPEIKEIKKKDLSLWENQQLPAIVPDILAADFFAYQLEELPAEQFSAWVLAAIGLSQTKTKKALDNEKMRENFSRLGRILFDLNVTLQGGFNIDRLCSQISENPPYYRWISENLSNAQLDPHIKRLAICANLAYLDESPPPETKASLLTDLGAQGSDTNKTEALRAHEQAAVIYEQLAHEDPSKYLMKYALSLNNISAQLYKLDKDTESLKFNSEAVRVFASLMKSNLPIDWPLYCSIITNFSIQLLRNNEQGNALQFGKQAVDLSRDLVKENKKNTRLLAASLLNYSLIKERAGLLSDALTACEESYKLFSTLLQSNYYLYLYEYAKVLTRYSDLLYESNDRNAALDLQIHAMKIYYKAAQDNFSLYGSSYSDSVKNYTSKVVRLGDFEKIFVAIQQAVSVFHSLFKSDPYLYGHDYAKYLTHLSLILYENNHADKAIHNIRLAVSVYSHISKGNDSAYDEDYAFALYILAARLNDKGELQMAIVASKKAIEKLEKLPPRNNANKNMYIPECYYNHSVYLRSVDLEGSQNAAQKSINHLLELDVKYINTYNRIFTNAVNNYLDVFNQSEKPIYIKDTVEKITNILEQLAQNKISENGETLARSLNFLAEWFDLADKISTAITHNKRVIDIYEVLSCNNFSKYGPHLADHLLHLSIRYLKDSNYEKGLEVAIKSYEVGEKLTEEDYDNLAPIQGENLMKLIANGFLYKPFIIRTKEIYLQFKSLSSAQWISDYPGVITVLFDFANKRGNMEVKELLESIMEEIGVSVDYKK
ncbi:MAG: ATP-binding protein [Candidatus Thiodiazotropha sp. (ex Lucina pensylvanica)]|nr:ATP-binding protein [Candidatus Thiodiazotropha sp. (ex Lucina pensylvanica)]